MGSTRKAQVLGVIAARKGFGVAEGTSRKPAGNGPKPLRYCSSEEKPTMEMVRPWKLLPQTTISARPADIFLLTSFSPHFYLRAALRACLKRLRLRSSWEAPSRSR